MKTCPYCEAEIANNAKKCKYCGETVVEEKEVKLCPFCEAEVSDTAKKCKHCGEWVNNKNYKKENGYSRTISNNQSNEKKHYTQNNFKKTIFSEFCDNHFSAIMRLSIFIIAIIIGFFIPKEYSGRIYILFCIFSLVLAGLSIFEEGIFIAIFGITFMSGIYYLFTIFSTFILARGLYKIGLMGPMTYSHIICDKVTGTFKSCNIKGNVSFDTGEKIYHIPGCSNYSKTVIDRDYGESMFPSKEIAEKAGFRKCKDEINIIYSDEYDPRYDYIDDYDSFMPRGH